MTKNHHVIVKDQSENQELFSCSVENIEQAYSFAKEMESLGIEVYIQAPSLPETLALELGSEKELIQKLKQEIQEEITSHHQTNCSK